MSPDPDQNARREVVDIASLMRAGDEHLREGRGSPAEACFRKILELQPDNPDALHRCGMIAFLRGDPREAAGLLGRAASIRTDDAILFGHLGNALMACGELDEAIAYLQRAIDSAPDYAAAYVKLGDACYGKGDIQASENAYRRSIEIAPDDPRAFVGLGRVLHVRKQNRDAEDALHRALELGGGATDVCMPVGMVLIEAGAAEAALELFEAVVRAEPDEARGHASMGLALHCLDRLDEAQAAYRRALNIDPRHPLALKHLGVLLQERDQLEAAADCFAKFLEAFPDDGVARHMLAATSGETTPSAPHGFVTRLFDDYADRFEVHLETIEYRVPEFIRDGILEVVGDGEYAWRILDLGCGTGLCGEAVRPLASYLAGIDLSSRMIAKARQRNVYDSLTVGSIEDALEGRQQAFDVIVAGDVFIYVGDLSDVLPNCAHSLSAGGLMAFSVESIDGDSYRLQPTGRYAHSTDYIDAIAARAGLSVKYRRDIVVRKDPEPIPGQIVVLAKPV